MALPPSGCSPFTWSQGLRAGECTPQFITHSRPQATLLSPVRCMLRRHQLGSGVAVGFAFLLLLFSRAWRGRRDLSLAVCLWGASSRALAVVHFGLADVSQIRRHAAHSGEPGAVVPSPTVLPESACAPPPLNSGTPLSQNIRLLTIPTQGTFLTSGDAALPEFQSARQGMAGQSAKGLF